MSADQEQQAIERLKDAVATIQKDLEWYWHWGDGEGGYVLSMLANAVRETGRAWPNDEPKQSRRKEKISRKLARAVMERDAYRCKHCDTHLDLTCDHIVAEAKGGPTTLVNLQTLCRSCNSKKGVL